MEHGRAAPRQGASAGRATSCPPCACLQSLVFVQEGFCLAVCTQNLPATARQHQILQSNLRAFFPERAQRNVLPDLDDFNPFHIREFHVAGDSDGLGLVVPEQGCSSHDAPPLNMPICCRSRRRPVSVLRCQRVRLTRPWVVNQKKAAPCGAALPRSNASGGIIAPGRRCSTCRDRPRR